MVHKSQVEGYNGSMEALVEEIGNLKYNALAGFLDLLAAKIERDGEKDKGRGRIKLAKQLEDCSGNLKNCKTSIEKAWVICEPYTK
ncbi:MAG: hypothetical protein AB8B69_03985 [Chitinophagales bacterium]